MIATNGYDVAIAAIIVAGAVVCALIAYVYFWQTRP